MEPVSSGHPAISRGLDTGSNVLGAPGLVKNPSFAAPVNPFEKFRSHSPLARDLQTSLPPPTSVMKHLF